MKKRTKIVVAIVLVFVIAVTSITTLVLAAPSINLGVTTNNNTANLTWINNDDVKVYEYDVKRSVNGGSYNRLDDVEADKVTVLNVYPDTSSNETPSYVVGENISFTTYDGENCTLKKSASLKKWMEEPNATDSRGYGRGLIEVTPVAITDFNNNPSAYLYKNNGKYNYDVVVFGTWDANGQQDISSSAVSVMQTYLSEGNSCVVGHDTIMASSTAANFNTLRSYFNIKLRDLDGLTLPDGGNPGNVNGESVDADGNTKVTLQTDNVFTTYPWYIGGPGTVLTVPLCHGVGQVAYGDVEITFTAPDQNMTDQNGNGNWNYYLTVNNKCAMIQTGHSNCKATDDEQKIWANLLFYLGDISSTQKATDPNFKDIDAPNIPTMVNNDLSGLNGTFTYTAEDNGTTYNYIVEATEIAAGEKTSSNTVTKVRKTEVAGYSYVIDNNSNTTVDDSIDTTTTSIDYKIGDGPNTYIHIKAIDGAGNVGPTAHILLHENEPPVLDLEPDITEWTNGNVIITAVGTDPDGRVVKIQKPDGTIVNSDTTTFEVEQNGDYTFVATDNSGASTTKTINIPNIDKVNPQGTPTIKQPTTDVRAAVITINATDDLSGVNRIIDPDGVNHAGDTADFKTTTPGRYTFTIYDNAGNMSTVDVDLVIDSDGVEVKFVDVGNGNEEISSKVNLSGKVGEDYTTEEKVIPGYELVKIPANATGKYTIDKQTVVYEYKLNSNVTTRYIDQLTGNEIRDDLVVKYKQDDVYSTSSENIDGYTLVKTPTNKNGIVQREDITVTYEYRRITQGVEIQYIDQANGAKISNSIIKNGVEGTEYTSEAKDIPGYELVKTPENANGEMTVEKTIVKYEYRLISYVTVNYEDEVTRMPLKAPVSTKYLEGQNYTSTQETFDGYTFSRVEGTPNGTMGRKNIVITYYYKKNTNVIVKYVDMLDGNREIHDAKTIAGVEGQAYTTEPIEISGYEYIRSAGKTSGNMTTDTITVIYKYKKLATLTTTHIDIDNGQEIHEPVVTTYKEGDTYEALPQNIAGYVKIEEPEEKTGIMGREDITRTYKYRKISEGLVVKYVDVKTNEVLDEVVYNGNVGDVITLDRKSFMYYLLYSKPNFDTVTLTDEHQEVIYYYVRSIKMDVIGVDEETGKELFHTKIEGPEGDPYDEEDKKDLDGYELVEMPANAKGFFNRRDTEIKFVYRKLEQKIETSVVAKYIDRDTEKELDSATIIGYVGDPYRTDRKEFAGYELVKIEGNEYGKMEEDQKVVKYIYTRKSGKVIVTYEDEEGNVIDSEELTGKVEEDYEVKVKEIDGYEVVKIPDNVKGKYTEDIIEVRIKLQKIQVAPAEKGTIIVKFVDSQGNTIREKIVQTGDVGEKFYFEAPQIDGYRIVINPNIKAEYTNEEQVFDVIYEKIPVEKPEEPKEEKEVETGDINILALVAILGISVIGIKKQIIAK